MDFRTEARVLLSRLLPVVPVALVEAVRRRWLSGHTYLRPVVGVLRHRPLGGQPFELPDRKIRLLGVDSRIIRLLYWHGAAGYEGEEAALWEHHCSTAERVVELGANVGYYTVVGAAACQGRYTAVEPNPEAAAIVRANLALNSLDRAAVVEAAVVPERNGPVRLALPDRERYVAPSGAYLEDAEDIYDRDSTCSITVDSIGINELLGDGCDLLKLDIEGYEHVVLAAALPRLKELRPVIFLELRDAASTLRDWVDAHLSDDWSMQQIGERDVILSPR